MAATIEYGRWLATLRDRRWTCSDPTFQTYLRGVAADYDYSPALGDYDIALAEQVVRQLGSGARLVSFDPPVAPPPGAVE